MTPTDKPKEAVSLLCTTSGCGRRWTCDFGRRLCSECDAVRNARPAVKRQAPVPGLPTLRDAVRPYAEPAEREFEEF